MKLDPLLREKLGVPDPPQERFRVIVEYVGMPLTLDISNLQRVGAQIVSISKYQPTVTILATKEQILRLERDPRIKKLWYSQEVGIL